MGCTRSEHAALAGDYRRAPDGYGRNVGLNLGWQWAVISDASEARSSVSRRRRGRGSVPLVCDSSLVGGNNGGARRGVPSTMTNNSSMCLAADEVAF